MAGHSKWSTIKHKKAKEDAKRGKRFTKLIKEITVCARLGGGDPNHNARLRLLLEKAKEINMPQENATRAIKRGLGDLPGQSYESYLYEGYGPGNTAIIIDVLTDNKNRAVSDLRLVFSKNGGSLAESGAVKWQFEHLGVVRVACPDMTEEQMLEHLLEHDVHEVSIDEDVCTVTCDLRSLETVKQAVPAACTVESAELEWVPNQLVSLSESDTEKAYVFLEKLEDLDDVQNVYTNLA